MANRVIPIDRASSMHRTTIPCGTVRSALITTEAVLKSTFEPPAFSTILLVRSANVAGSLFTKMFWFLSTVIVTSVAVCFLAVLAWGRFTGNPCSRTRASEDSMKNTRRKNIVSIIGMISIFVRLSSRLRLNSKVHSLLTLYSVQSCMGRRIMLRVPPLRQRVQQLSRRLLGFRGNGPQTRRKIVVSHKANDRNG